MLDEQRNPFSAYYRPVLDHKKLKVKTAPAPKGASHITITPTNQVFAKKPPTKPGRRES